jgi:uncharacterized RDD family membrane protein YckC
VTVAQTIRNPRGREAQGKPAGIVSRGLANGIDLGIAWIITFVLLGAWTAVRYVAFGDPLIFPRPHVSLTVGLFWAVLILYLADAWGSDGKTIGKRIVGLRAEAAQHPLRARRWLLRSVLCVAIWPIVMGSVLLARDNRGLHDRLLGTRVVYDWSRH